MTASSNSNDYGRVAKWLHWSVAILFLCSYLSVYYRQWFTEKETPANWTALQLHLSVGITIAVLVFLRVFWRLTNRYPALEPGPRWQQVVTHSGHYALYAIMIIMPLTGYLGTGVSTEYFFLFDIPKFEDTRVFESVVHNGMGMSFEEFEKGMDYVHKNILGEWVAWMLILGHSSAALYHHYIVGDRTLAKMTTGSRQG